MLLRRFVSQSVAGSDTAARAGAAGPIIVIEAISRSVIEDMMDRIIRSAVEDVLLIGNYGHQGGGIAGSGRSAGERRPVVVIEAIGERIPEDVLNCVVCASIEDMLLLRAESDQGRGIAN